MSSSIVPPARRARNPLITEAGYSLLQRITQHPLAPKWNYEVGDRVIAADLQDVELFRAALRAERSPGSIGPPPRIRDWIRSMHDRVTLFGERLAEGFDLERDWAYVPTMNREDIAVRIDKIVPAGVDLTRMIVYDTSGTTGHAIVVPYHPVTMAQNHPLLEYVLSRYGASPKFDHDHVACFNVGAQASTVVFPMVFSVWKQAGFAKVNLHPRCWAEVEQARQFFEDLAPQFITGDPVGFAEMIRWEIPIRPSAMVSTAVALSAGLKARLEASFGCPVIDYYSSTETGPIAYACPDGRGMCILPHDIYVEIVDAEGFPVTEGERGEIAVTGGRNPYLPLLRYRTGDFGRFEKVPGGEAQPRIFDLEAREAVVFRAADGSAVSPVDIGRILRLYPVVMHELVQRGDGSCDLAIRPPAGAAVDEEEIKRRLETLFGAGSSVHVTIDENLGESGKSRPFRSELT
ncbi:MAG: phenylacetate--CoA ligase family protein [Acidobacteria bacterium]|nr:phenylacetate--CoA ligase family protein [Acidobacteriota bacterium]